jgi:catechol-2,3-dioxygenase
VSAIRPESQWPRTPQGDLAMVTAPLDLDELLSQDAVKAAAIG